jgi:UDP-N-acetylglucosamine transferase subunit ALG13
MIFITVGTDQPFDRMLKVVDAWAADCGRTDLFAQIGVGGWEPKSIPFSHVLSPVEFKQRFMAASVIVGHAGMGTILSALHYGKPILVMPKKASLKEQRNEHQLATARRMMKMGNVAVAFDESELREKLDHLADLVPKEKISSTASGPLVEEIRRFVFLTDQPSPTA